jgi:hypothetical protein
MPSGENTMLTKRLIFIYVMIIVTTNIFTGIFTNQYAFVHVQANKIISLSVANQEPKKDDSLTTILKELITPGNNNLVESYG